MSKPIVKVRLTGDLEDIWYSATEPDGKRYDWDHFYQVEEFYEKMGWEVEWEAKASDIRFLGAIPQKFHQTVKEFK